MNMHDPKMQEAVTSASKCLQTCLTTHTHCLEKGGAHVAHDHMQLLTDCIKICETSLNFMSRSSRNHAKVCAVCADICESCAESCTAFEDDQMQQCASACRICAQSCRSMAA